MAEPFPLPAPTSLGEARLIAAARAGTVADLADLAPAQRLVRGALLRCLLSGLNEDGRRTEAGVRLLGAVIAGPVLLDGLGADEPAAPLVLRHALPAAGAGIPLLARGARFVALDLGHSRLARLEARGLDCPALTLTGLAIATPDGRVDLEGAQLGAASALSGIGPAQPGEAGPLLNLAGARLAGALTLAGGRLRQLVLVGAAVAGDVALDGAVLTAAGDAPALLANSVRIGGALRLSGTRVQGQLRLISAHVEGGLHCQGCTLHHPGEAAILADGSRLGALSFAGSSIRGEVRAIAARIAGGVSLDRTTRLAQPLGDALSLDQATIAGAVRLDGARVAGCVRLRAAEVAGGLQLTAGSQLGVANGPALVLAEATLDHLRLEGSSIAGQVALGGARLGWEARLEQLSLSAAPGQLAALDGAGLAVETLVLRGLRSQGRIQLDNVQVFGTLCLEALTMVPASAALDATSIADPAVLLSLRRARIGRLEVSKLTLARDAVADLRTAQLAILADAGGEAWGQAVLRLDGLVFSRLAEPPMGQKAARQARLAFLLRQYPRGRPNAATFSGGAFSQVAQTLRAMGQGADADWFARARRRLRRTAGVPVRPLGTWADGLVGLCFGDFYSGRRTLATLLLWIGLGAGGLWAANLQGMLRGSAGELCWSHTPGVTLPALDRHIPLPPQAVALEAAKMAVGLSLPGLPTGWASRCHVAAAAPPGWHWGRQAYQLLGTLLLLLSAASFTGLFRRD